MYQIIAPTLFQNKTCRLPGIGTLTMVNTPAYTNFVNSRIVAPVESISFIPEESGENIFNEFSAIAELLKQQLDEKGQVFLKGVGSFFKGSEGEFTFEAVQIDTVFFQPVTAERVIRENTEHTMLVGDQRTTNFQMTEFFNEKPLLKSRWKIWALLLGIVGACLLLFYLYTHGFNSLGNVNSI